MLSKQTSLLIIKCSSLKITTLARSHLLLKLNNIVIGLIVFILPLQKVGVALCVLSVLKLWFITVVTVIMVVNDSSSWNGYLCTCCKILSEILKSRIVIFLCLLNNVSQVHIKLYRYLKNVLAHHLVSEGYGIIHSLKWFIVCSSLI